MKKLVFSMIALLCFCVKIESKNFEVWRTSIVIGTFDHPTLTTASAYVYKIEVGSGTPGSQFEIVGGTWIGRVSSTRTYDTDTSGNYYYPLMSYPTGFMLNTVGNSTVYLYWDYLFKSPKGQESKGLDNR